MKNVIFFTIYIVFFAICSSLIFSILYMQFDEQPMLALNKAIKYGAILLCIIFILPAIKLQNIYSKEKLGFCEPKLVFLKNTVKGFLLSLILSFPLLITMFILGIRNIDFSLLYFDSYFFLSILLITFLSFLIAFIEESFFRGILVQKKETILNTFFIVALSSFIYSVFHFLKIPLIIDENLVWYTGLTELFYVFSNLFNLISYDAALTLFLFGILLSIIRINLNSISYCVGIHAGFIFIIKLVRQNSTVNFESGFDYLLSPYDHFTGYLSSGWIIIMLLVLILVISKRAFYN